MERAMDATDALKGLAGVIESVAPGIASMLGGPLAGSAVRMVEGALGMKGADAAALASAATSPAAQLALAKAEMQHKLAMAQIGAGELSARLADVKDARQAGAAYPQFLKSLAWFVTLGFFIALGALFLPISLDSSVRQLLSMLVGVLVSKWQTIIDFFYGSSNTGSTSNMGTMGEKK